MKIINGSVCTPKGFLSAGVFAGLKKNPEKKDIALIYSEAPATAAGVFTINKVKAAPVILTEQHLKSGRLQAIITNSGNANACTGAEGMRDAHTMAAVTAKALNIDAAQVAVSSTGVIGVPLPIDKVVAGIEDARAQLSRDDTAVANAILTTDTFVKTAAVSCEINGKTIHIGGCAKGSGMIHPMMATMLAYITTDAAISAQALQHALTEANHDSFHMISVDGDTSTNDMVLVLANGMAGNAEINDPESAEWKTFFQALQIVCISLAKQIAEDGEGASKMIEIKLSGAASKNDARQAARAVCRSPLVKTAVFGEDANWGRVACAVGAAGIDVNPERLSILLGDLILLKNGKPLPFDEALALAQLQKKIVTLSVDLGIGAGEATAWGCDLTYDYIKINASYRS